MDMKTAAGQAEKVVEGFMRVEPIVMTMSSFVPGAAPVMAMVHPAVVALAPFIEKALTDIAAGNNSDAFSAVFQLIQHISRGQPNIGLLGQLQQMAADHAHPAGAAPATGQQDTIGSAGTDDSRLGSG